MPYWRLFYHLVWSTKKRMPMLTPQVAPVVYNLLRTKAIGLGATVFAINGTENHVHMVASVPPKIAISAFIGKVKASASKRYNRISDAERPFFWQEEYGAFSFDGKRLPCFLAYVNNQDTHHKSGSVIPVLERVEGEIELECHELSTPWEFEDESWRNEMLALENIE